MTLLAVCLAVFMLLLDMTIVSAALADIQASLGAGLNGLQWVVDAYALPMAGLLLTAATVGDRLGRRRLYLGGMVVFTLASVGCARADSIEMLNLTRSVQGAAGAVLLGVSLPLIAAVYPEGRGRAVAIAIYGAVMGAGGAVGPLLGGALVDRFGWPAIFLVNVPIGLAALLIGAVYIPENRAAQVRPVDIVGTVVLSAALFSGVYVLIEGDRYDWRGPLVGVLSGFCVIAMVVFVRWEMRVAEPMLDMSVLRRPGFAGVALAAFVSAATLMATTNYLALYFMNTLGFSAFEAGVRALPLTVAIVLGAPAAMFAARRAVAVPVAIPACVALIAMGLWLMTDVTAATEWTHFIAGSVVAGIGLGGLAALTSEAALQFVRVEDAGMATGTVSTVRQVGILAGVAGLGELFGRHGGDGPGMDRATSAAGLQDALVVAAGAATAGLIVVVVLIGIARRLIVADPAAA
ncbi:MFS transporter [Mycolicibacterium sp. HK-90]|uniref:MFS transporter n=1 Tax=Mycolicibacterium sp. HK-90 TaxID=3056937 RepID=UPI003462F800